MITNEAGIYPPPQDQARIRLMLLATLTWQLHVLNKQIHSRPIKSKMLFNCEDEPQTERHFPEPLCLGVRGAVTYSNKTKTLKIVFKDQSDKDDLKLFITKNRIESVTSI